MPTREEIENLKAQWKGDGTWDIEDTPGFEEHREELEAYRDQVEAEYQLRRHHQLEKKAEDLGCPGNLTLADYVDTLENKLMRRIERLEERIYD